MKALIALEGKTIRAEFHWVAMLTRKRIRQRPYYADSVHGKLQ